MDYRGFKITNEPAYIWRTYCWGSHAGHNHVPCWYVQDATGKRVVGGFYAGNNTRSGYANVPRRKDAKAWVDGFLAFANEPENRELTKAGFYIHGPTYGLRNHERDEEQQAFFDEGYYQAQCPRR